MMSSNKMNELVNISQAADILEVSRQTIYAWLSKGKLKPEHEAYKVKLFDRRKLEMMKRSKHEDPAH